MPSNQSRCGTLVTNHQAAAERLSKLNAVVQRATTRIDELNKDLAGATEDARTLANALAGVVPHIHGETCPVCNRDFADQGAGPLSAHVAAKIASLTSQAGRLQALATERAEESNRLAQAARELMSADNGQLSAEQLADNTVRRAYMADLVRRLRDLGPTAIEGGRLMTDAIATRQTLILARRRDEASVSMLPEIETAVQAAIGQPASNFASIEAALEEAIRHSEVQATDELLPVWWTRCLARGGDPLELHRADVADGRVASLRVVEELDVVEHVGAGLVTCAVDLAGCALGFQRRKEALHRGIVPDVAGAARAACHTVVGHELLKLLTGVLG